jgi:hypothetical protein
MATNKIEAIKAAKDGLNVRPDLQRYTIEGFERSPLHIWFDLERELAAARESVDMTQQMLAELGASVSDLRSDIRRQSSEPVLSFRTAQAATANL